MRQMGDVQTTRLLGGAIVLPDQQIGELVFHSVLRHILQLIAFPLEVMRIGNNGNHFLDELLHLNGRVWLRGHHQLRRSLILEICRKLINLILAPDFLVPLRRQQRIIWTPHLIDGPWLLLLELDSGFGLRAVIFHQSRSGFSLDSVELAKHLSTNHLVSAFGDLAEPRLHGITREQLFLGLVTGLPLLHYCPLGKPDDSVLPLEHPRLSGGHQQVLLLRHHG
mmetsp:Transcript_26619/g.64103  ORF Transcript_26619/g.64103 Transcript_26619/m.64103 type:complete len:223 (-) Transcript_26619:92-760(-)